MHRINETRNKLYQAHCQHEDRTQMVRRANSNTPEDARSINLKTELVSCRDGFRSYCAQEKSCYCTLRWEGENRGFFQWHSKKSFHHQRVTSHPTPFDDDIITYRYKYNEHKLPLSTLWRHTLRAVADHQLQFQTTAALPAGKEPLTPEMVWTILGKENLLRPSRIETRIVQPVDLSLHFIPKLFVLNCTTLCKSREPRNGDRVQFPNFDDRRVRSVAAYVRTVRLQTGTSRTRSRISTG